jgi:hypothetical protein
MVHGNGEKRRLSTFFKIRKPVLKSRLFLCLPFGITFETMEFSLSKSLEILERGPAVYRTLLQGLSGAWTTCNEGPDTWSAFDIVGHLIHGERTDWLQRMEIILSDAPEKTFKPFDRFAQFEESKGKTMEELLTAFETIRAFNISVLRSKNLQESDLKKKGMHPALGEVTLAQLLSTWTTHDLAHLNQKTPDHILKIYLTDQSGKFNEHLANLVNTPVMKYNKGSMTERLSAVHLNGAFEALDPGVLMNYHVFPPNIMSYLTEWTAEKREMRAGDTIVQQVFLPPIKNFSQKILFGVRIKEVINEPLRKGFSYETLEGHAEKGLSIFTIEQEGSETFFKIRTFSAGGNILARLAGPFFTRPYQAYCTRLALKHVRSQMEKP